jgi:hypothetical protein
MALAEPEEKCGLLTQVERSRDYVVSTLGDVWHQKRLRETVLGKEKLFGVFFLSKLVVDF